MVRFVVFKDLLTSCPGDNLELLASCRPVNVNREQQWLAILIRRQPAGDFPGRRCLARALQAHDHDNVWDLPGKNQPGGLAAQHVDQFVKYYLDDLLGRVEFLPNLLSLSLFLDRGYKVLCDFIIDVGFKKGETNLAQGRVNVL